MHPTPEWTATEGFSHTTDLYMLLQIAAHTHLIGGLLVLIRIWSQIWHQFEPR